MSTTLKAKYIQLILKASPSSRNKRIQPLVEYTKIMPVEQGLNDASIIETLVALHQYFESLTNTDAMYTTLTQLLAKYIEALPHVTLMDMHVAYIRTLLHHSNSTDNNALHGPIVHALRDILDTKSGQEVRPVLGVMSNADFSAYSCEDREQLVDVLLSKHATERIIRPIIKLLQTDMLSSLTRIPQDSLSSASLIDRLGYFVKMAETDTRAVQDVETTLYEVLNEEYVNIAGNYDKVCDAMKLVLPHDIRVIDHFLKHCVQGSIPTDKMASVIGSIVPILSEEYVSRFVETTRSHISLMKSRDSLVCARSYTT